MAAPTLAPSSWEAAEHDLGYQAGDPINIGWHCSDRLCELGLADTVALRWENHEGKARTYTYDDLRVKTNTLAAWLQHLGLQPGERICLFMDRVPELYLGFLAILKMGGIAQPLFSAFGDESLHTRLENAGTAAIITQKKHVLKVRKLVGTLPALRHIIVVDAPEAALKACEISLDLDALPPVDAFDVYPEHGRDAVGAALHLRHHRSAQGRAARPLLACVAVSHLARRPRPQAGRHLLVQRRSRLGDGDELRHHRPVGLRRDAGGARRRLPAPTAGTPLSRSTGSPSGTRPRPRSGC